MDQELRTEQRRGLEPEEAIRAVLGAVRDSPYALQKAIESIPAPIYLTDEDGWVTFFNSACVNFSGRTPVVGKDRWCVTWRLMTDDGRPLPHEECPMARAIRLKREVRGVVAIAERPDGTRVLFTPYPTPIHSEEGAFAGAVNLLIDITEERQANSLRQQAKRCRRLARGATDERTTQTLSAMAKEYEDKADRLGELLRGSPD